MTVSFDVSGKVALVTGASGGLGAQFARCLAEAGAKVALTARRLDALQSLSDELNTAGATTMPVAMDVTKRDQILAALDQVEAEWGLVDVLVNNSGIVVSKPIFEHTEDDWDSILDVNLKGAWMAGQEVARRLVEADKSGSIINISSALGYGRVSSQIHEYCASKAGLIHLTKSMATELAPMGVRVNALAPGYVITDLNRDWLTGSSTGERLRQRIPQQRFAEADELDGVILLLASDAAAYMTGSVVEIDGGLSVVSV